MNGQNTDWRMEVTYLSLSLDNKLLWNKHELEVINKFWRFAEKKLGMQPKNTEKYNLISAVGIQ